jgi:hypothetical protein
MAKYILLRFEDEDEAELFKKYYPVAAELKGVYKAPTMFCHCTSVKGRGWTKGQKWGWWVCDICGKPSPKAQETLIKESAFGFNLLESP